MTSTAESTCGGGRNACRGSVRPTMRLNRRQGRVAYLRTTARCSTRSAATSLLPGASSVRSRSAEIPYGGFATTRKGRPGSGMAVASACSTVMPGNRWRRTSARRGCSSTATTRAPARTRCAVSAPSPAPRSSTSSPGRTPAAATTRAAHSSASRCQPHSRRDRPEAGTTDHQHVATHAPTVARHGHGDQFVFRGRTRVPRRPAHLVALIYVDLIYIDGS
jgi:hypothetical protein